MGLRTEKVKEGQSLVNIAIEFYGDAAGQGQLILDNPDVFSFDSLPEVGKEFVIDDQYIINKDNVSVFKTKRLSPATASDMVHSGFSNGFSNGFN